MKDYDVLNNLVPKTQELHRTIFDKGYEQGQKDALEQQTCEGKNCISREAVLEILKKNRYRFNISQEGYCSGKVLWGENLIKDDACKEIEQLPPVIPIRKESDDCISREDAMTALRAEPSFVCSGDKLNAIRVIEGIPPVTPKEKTGCWIDTANEIDVKFGKHAYKCPNCGKYADYFVMGVGVWWDRIKPNLCPNCGIHMIETQESDDKQLRTKS